jgi:hypothetical protein
VQQASGTALDLATVAFTSPTTGFAAGAEGIILRTTDGGTTWTRQTNGLTGYDWFTSVSFTDANTGTVVSWNKRIYRTTNGGATWVQQINPTGDSITGNGLLTVVFTDANTGTATGSWGTILHTTDGGEHWVEQESGVATPYLWGLAFTDDGSTGIAVGKTGTILRTTGNSSSVEMMPVIPDIHQPSLLGGNYPNPVGASTTIRFHVVSAGEVVIDLLDEVNNSVGVVFDRRMEPGDYSATFDTRDLPSGVYYYRIRSGGVIETKKLVVVR